MVQPFACCRPIRLPRGAAEERCGAVFRLLSTPPTSLAYAHLEAVKKVSHRHSPADLSGFVALNTRLILRIGLRLIALKPNKSSRRASVRFF